MTRGGVVELTINIMYVEHIEARLPLCPQVSFWDAAATIVVGFDTLGSVAVTLG